MDQAKLCVHTSNLFRHPYQEKLAERLCAMTGLDRAFFSSTGNGGRRGRAQGRSRAAPGRAGRAAQFVPWPNAGSLAVTGQPKYRRPFEPLAPQTSFVEPNDCGGLERAVTSGTAGIILEPILGEGGVIPLEAGFLRLARALATRSGALLIADEIQSGLGRTGRRFAYEEVRHPAGHCCSGQASGRRSAAGRDAVQRRSRRRAAARNSRDDLRRRTAGLPVALEFLT